MKNLLFNVLMLLAALGYTSNTLIAQPNKILSDEFESSISLKKWKRFHKQEGWPDMMKTLEIKSGQLILQPNTSGWYADYQAPFLFQEIKGDFIVETKLKVEGYKTKWPQTTWSLSGLMVRAPKTTSANNWQPNQQNWLFLTYGVARKLNQAVFETKTTINSKSRLKLHPTKLDWVQLKIERKASTFTLWYKFEKQAWVNLETFERPDLPAKLQVGLNAYTDFYSAGKELMSNVYKYNTTVVNYGKPDLKVLVEYVRFYQK